MGASEYVPAIKSEAEFHEKVTGSSDTVIVDCFAEWCGPCKAIAPVVDKLAQEFSAKGIKFYQVDVDELSNVAAELGVRAMPTFMIFQNGEKTQDIVGANAGALKAALEKIAA